MAVRLRKDKEGFYKVLCAAESKPEKGDIYLDDAMDEALNAKYYEDFYKMGALREEWIPEYPVESSSKDMNFKV